MSIGDQAVEGVGEASCLIGEVVQIHVAGGEENGHGNGCPIARGITPRDGEGTAGGARGTMACLVGRRRLGADVSYAERRRISAPCGVGVRARQRAHGNASEAAAGAKRETGYASEDSKNASVLRLI